MNAERDLQRANLALEDDPNDATAHHVKGNALRELGENEEAIASYLYAINLNPKNPGPYLGCCASYIALERFRDAIDICDAGLRHNPNNADLHFDQGLAYMGLNDRAEAFMCFDTASELDGKDAMAHFLRGKTLQGARIFEFAIESYNKAIEINKKMSEAFINKSSVLNEQQKYDQALAVLDEALKLEDENKLDILQNKADLLFNLEKYDEAIKVANQVLEINETSTDAHLTIANCLSAQGELDQAISEYDIVIELNDAPEAHYYKGRAYSANENYYKAIDCFNVVIDKNESYVGDAWWYKGDALQRSGQQAEADDCFEKAKLIDPTCGETVDKVETSSCVSK